MFDELLNIAHQAAAENELPHYSARCAIYILNVTLLTGGKMLEKTGFYSEWHLGWPYMVTLSSKPIIHLWFVFFDPKKNKNCETNESSDISFLHKNPHIELFLKVKTAILILNILVKCMHITAQF